MTPATQRNLERKASYADQLQIVDGQPLFSWIDLNVTELCNRSGGSPKACAFCPRIDPEVYPNQRLHMTVALTVKIGEELRSLNYRGAVTICGFGEPLLHPRLPDLVAGLRGLQVEIVTNGDRLTPQVIRELVDAGTSYFVVSMYDGPHQVNELQAKFHTARCLNYILRDRWYDESGDFGLKLTNRAGTINVGAQDPVDVTHPCFYPSYQLTIDWNGDVLLCVQDWHKKLRFGNANAQSLLDIWRNPAFYKRRMQLIRGDRSASPCSGCNANGTLHGADHAKAWSVRLP